MWRLPITENGILNGTFWTLHAYLEWKLYCNILACLHFTFAKLPPWQNLNTTITTTIATISPTTQPGSQLQQNLSMRFKVVCECLQHHNKKLVTIVHWGNYGALTNFSLVHPGMSPTPSPAPSPALSPAPSPAPSPASSLWAISFAAVLLVPLIVAVASFAYFKQRRRNFKQNFNIRQSSEESPKVGDKIEGWFIITRELHNLSIHTINKA